MSCSVVFSGTLQNGVSREQAQASLARLFGVDDPSRLNHYFSGTEQVIKAGLDAAQAEKIRQALARAGLLASVRDDSPLLDIPAPPRTSSGLIAASSTGLALEPMAAPATPELALEPAAAPARPALSLALVPEPGIDHPAAAPAPAPAAAPAFKPELTVAPAPGAVSAPHWVVVKPSGERLGPFTREQIITMAQAGQVTVVDRIWKPGLNEPVPATSLGWIRLSRQPAIPQPGVYSMPESSRRPAYDALGVLNPVVLITGLVLVGLNTWLFLAAAPAGSAQQSLPYCLGEALGMPALFIGISALTPSRRHAAANARMLMYAGLVTLVSALVQVSTRLHNPPVQPQVASSAQAEQPTASRLIPVDELQQYAQQTNAKLPLILDLNTRWESVSTEGRTLVLHYSLINTPPGGIDYGRFGQAMQAEVQPRMCNDPGSQSLMRRGVSYRILYTDRDQHQIWQMYVNPGMCGISPGG